MTPEPLNTEQLSTATPLRLGHCLELLAAIFDRPSLPADARIGSFFAARRYLGSHDRGMIAETVYGVLRNAIRLHWMVGGAARDSGHGAALLIGAYLVETDPSFGDPRQWEALGLKRGTVEKLRADMIEARSQMEELPEPERTAVRCSVPIWFAGRIREQFGAPEAGLLLESLGRQAPITLRANRLRTTREELAAALAARGIASVPGIYAPDALLLERRMNANAIPEFKQGWFELQDEGSQLLSTILDPHPNWTVFDACAGAGGKTLHMAAIMRGRGAITAHDVNARRLEELRPRLRRSGAQNVRMMPNEAFRARQSELAGTFDAVMIDAPCSGAGVFRRNPGAWLTFEEEVVERLVRQQADILREYAALVKPGGLLLYATCSLLREENEEQAERFLAEQPGWEPIRVNAPADMVTDEGAFRAFPHRHGTDGFFGALFRRVG